MWGKAEAGYIIGTFNGYDMQFYNSWQNRFIMINSHGVAEVTGAIPLPLAGPSTD